MKKYYSNSDKLFLLYYFTVNSLKNYPKIFDFLLLLIFHKIECFYNDKPMFSICTGI